MRSGRGASERSTAGGNDWVRFAHLPRAATEGDNSRHFATSLNSAAWPKPCKTVHFRASLPPARGRGRRAAQRAPHPTPDRARLLLRSRTTKLRILKNLRKTTRKNLRRPEILVTPFARFSSRSRKRTYGPRRAGCLRALRGEICQQR